MEIKVRRILQEIMSKNYYSRGHFFKIFRILAISNISKYTISCMISHSMLQKISVCSSSSSSSSRLPYWEYISANKTFLNCWKWFPRYCFIPKSKSVRTILFSIKGVAIGSESDAWILRYKYLWSLDLSDTLFVTLPNSIVKLEYLHVR